MAEKQEETAVQKTLGRFKGKRDGVQTVSYFVDADRVKLVPIGDIHLGANTCEIDKLAATLQWLYDNPDVLIVLMGDLLEFATKSSVGAGWAEQTGSPQAQMDALEEMFKPLAPRILVSLEGNHEERAWKATGIKVAKNLAKLIGVKYGGYSCFIRLKIRNQNYVIHAQHGSSNAWYPHTKLTAAMRTANHTDADVYLYGHTHELLSIKAPRREYDLRSRTVQRPKKYFVLTGGFLGYEYSYAQKKNMWPTQTGVARLTFSGNEWDVHIST